MEVYPVSHRRFFMYEPKLVFVGMGNKHLGYMASVKY